MKLESLGRWCCGRRRVVGLLWLVALAGAVVAGELAGGELDNNFSCPAPSPNGPSTCSRSGSPSWRATPPRSPSVLRTGGLRGKRAKVAKNSAINTVSGRPWVLDSD